jgi:hypothetical protein
MRNCCVDWQSPGSREVLCGGPNLRNNLYVPTQLEIKARASWTMGAAALIAQTQNTGEPGLKGCRHHRNGLEVMEIFNGSTDGMEDAFVAPTSKQPSTVNLMTRSSSPTPCSSSLPMFPLLLNSFTPFPKTISLPPNFHCHIPTLHYLLSFSLLSAHGFTGVCVVPAPIFPSPELCLGFEGRRMNR